MMSYNELQAAIETYYNCGSYANVEYALILKYLMTNNITPDDAFDKVTATHSKSYKSLPDVAMFRTALSSLIDASIEFEAIKAFEIVKNHIRTTEGVRFKDKRIGYALHAVGGVEGYFTRVKNDYSWLLKDFTRAFKQANEKKHDLIDIDFIGLYDFADKHMNYIGYTQEEVEGIKDKPALLEDSATSIFIGSAR